jgi:putative component of toxin-antitoxin plasmid stabilization module
VYFTRRQRVVIILLCGGDKSCRKLNEVDHAYPS